MRNRTGYLFAQWIRELIDKHSLDTFRAPAFNSVGRAAEIAQIVDEASLWSERLKPFISELRRSLSEDIVLCAASKTRAERSLSAAEAYLFPKKKKKGEQRSRGNFDGAASVLRVLARDLEADYRKNLFSKVLAAVSEEASDDFVYQVARNFVSELESRGFDARFIRHKAAAMLPTEAECGKTKIRKYLKIFDAKQQGWDVLMFGDANFANHKRAAKAFDIRVFDLKKVVAEKVTVEERIDDMPLPDGHRAKLPRLVEKILSANPRAATVVLMRGIEAKDPYRARSAAERLLSTFAGFALFHEEMAKFTWKTTAIICNASTSECQLNERSAGAMDYRRHFRSPSPTSSLFDAVAKTRRVTEAREIQDESRQAIRNVIEYHRAAAEIRKPEAQLVALWASLERFLPTAPDSRAHDKPGFYSGILGSLLSVRYAESVLGYVAQRILAKKGLRARVEDLRTASKKSKLFASSRRPRDPESLLIAALVCEELEDVRRSLLEALRDDPLREHQVQLCGRVFGDSERLAAALRRHATKVRWNMNRLYSARNIVVHSAGSAHRMEALVEIARSYLVGAVEVTVGVLEKRRELSSIDAAVHWIDNVFNEHLEKLSSRNVPMSLDTYAESLFPLPEARPERRVESAGPEGRTSGVVVSPDCFPL